MMAARSVQISVPGQLLDLLDRRPETKKLGRSAVVQKALVLYLDIGRRRETDAAYERAYGGKAGSKMFDEFTELMRGQRWPEK